MWYAVLHACMHAVMRASRYRITRTILYACSGMREFHDEFVNSKISVVERAAYWVQLGKCMQRAML